MYTRCSFLFLITLFFACLTAFPAYAQPLKEPIRMMPLGDSITESHKGQASYRYHLWKRFVAKQKEGCKVDFVGSKKGVHGGKPKYSNFDQNHEGHWGWRADQVLRKIGNWAKRYKPDIVLMHLGSNDAFRNQSANSTLNELKAIIQKLRQAQPQVTVIVAKLIGTSRSKAWNSRVNQLNAKIGSLVRLSTSKSKIRVVDQNRGFTPSRDTFDGIHPNTKGDQKLANKWYNAMRPVLPSLCR